VFREAGQFVVGAAGGVPEHPVDGPLTAQYGEETVGEEVGGARLWDAAAGRLGGHAVGFGVKRGVGGGVGSRSARRGS
jgi:hypothetical protein